MGGAAPSDLLNAMEEGERIFLRDRQYCGAQTDLFVLMIDESSRQHIEI